MSYDSWKLASPAEDYERDDGDPSEWEQAYDRVVAMAREDAAGGRDPRVLTGELAAFGDDYEDAYLEALLAKQKGAN